MSFIKEEPKYNTEFHSLHIYGTFRFREEIFMKINLDEAMYIFEHWKHPLTFCRHEGIERIDIKCEVITVEK